MATNDEEEQLRSVALQNSQSILHARRRAEEELRKQSEWLRVTLASIGDAVISTDAEGRVNFMNGVAEALTGWAQADALGHPLAEVFHIVNEQTRQLVENPAQRTLREGIVVRLANHTILISKNGTQRPIDDSAAPIRSADGEIVGCVLVFRDVTERLRAEEALQENDRQFRTLADSMPQLAWIANPDGYIFWYNRRWYEYTGTTFEQMQGWGWQSVHDPRELPKVLERWKSSIATGQSFEMVFPLKGKNGTFRPFLTLVSPQLDEEGRVVRWFGTNTDITETKRAEDDRQKFVMLAESITDFIGMCDLDAIPFYINQAGLEMVGLEGIKQVSSIPVREFFFPEDQSMIIDEFFPSVLQKGNAEIEVRFRHFKTGNALWMLFKVIALVDSQGNQVGLATVSRDITQRRELEDNLRQLAWDLAEGNRRKDEFLATLAHELRNPLAPVRNALQLMKLAKGNPETIEQARVLMERQIAQMVRLVDDLLDVSRITRGKIDLRRERVDLGSIIQQAVETSLPAIESARQELTMKLPSQPVYLNGDAVRLVQVFSNLLNNSCKYSEPDGSISISAERQGSDVVVTVKDTGIGIPPDMLPRIFEMFTQIDRSLERSEGGLGIGLTLVQRLVELHNGSIQASSEGAGKGSQFIVRLPIVVEDETPLPPLAKGESKLTTGRRILVVDDNRDSASSLAMLLRLAGNETQTAFDGLAAVEAAAAFEPDVVLLDIGLPRLNGYEVARKIRAQPWGKEMVLVALTGWGQDEDRKKSKDAGFNGHMVKPVDHTALTKLLAELLPTPS
jgi:PAS domain S-box-containing protein